MKMKAPLLILAILALLLQGCFSDSDADYDYGYGVGYSAGYNTTCKIRATMIKGDWDNEDYSRGYREGYTEGSYACRNKE
jgi:hypothetical protein